MNAQRVRTMAVWCGLCLIQSILADSSASAAGAGTPEAAVAASGEGPAFEASLDFCTRQLTYGLVDNRDPIVTAALAAEWQGFTFDTAVIFDTTGWGKTHGGYGNRKGQYQEVAFGPGYTSTFDPGDYPFLPTAVDAFVNYTYEYHPPVRKSRGESNPDTQFLHAGFALPDVWLSPTLCAEFDIDNEAGAVYLLGQVSHTFTLVEAAGGRKTDPLALSLGAGVGAGNPKRNRYDADVDAWAFKDVWVSAALEWQLSDRVLLAPYVALSEQLHRRLRDASRHAFEGETHASTQLVGGLALAATF